MYVGGAYGTPGLAKTVEKTRASIRTVPGYQHYQLCQARPGQGQGGINSRELPSGYSSPRVLLANKSGLFSVPRDKAE
jgi:hypothetical protein